MTTTGSYPRFTTAQVIEAVRQTKGLMTLTAKRLNCAPNTVRNYAKRFPTVAEAIREEREAMVDLAELALHKKIREGEGWAVQFTLKTLGKDRGYTERTELTGKDGGPIAIDDARETLTTRLAALAARRGTGSPDSESAPSGSGVAPP